MCKITATTREKMEGGLCTMRALSKLRARIKRKRGVTVTVFGGGVTDALQFG